MSNVSGMRQKKRAIVLNAKNSISKLTVLQVISMLLYRLSFMSILVIKTTVAALRPPIAINFSESYLSL